MEAQGAYDGLADWYDERLAPFTTALGDTVRDLLGAGAGACLDIGCGTGIHLGLLTELGWRVTGVDASGDMLRRARERSKAQLIRADAASLPCEDASFDAAVCVLIHTDVADYPAVLREAARVLRPRGLFVHVGLHPCFVGPFSRYEGPDEPPTLFRGYRETAWTNDAPGF